MNVIDLTQFIASDMPVYPGTEPPSISEATSIAADGFAEKLLTMYSHTGTHMDAPGHMLADSHTLDQLPIDTFVGPGVVIDLSARLPGRIAMQELVAHAGRIERTEFVLFHTGWSLHWGRDDYYAGFPTLSEEAARWLCGFGLKGVGFDCISVDPVGASPMVIHHILLGHDLVIIENLCGLDRLVNKEFLFLCLPLKIRDSDGSPVRATGVTLGEPCLEGPVSAASSRTTPVSA